MPAGTSTSIDAAGARARRPGTRGTGWGCAAGPAARDARRRGDDLAEDRAAHLAHLAACRRTRRSAPGGCPARSPSPRSARTRPGRRTSTVAVAPNAAWRGRGAPPPRRRARAAGPPGPRPPNGSPPKNASKMSPNPNASPPTGGTAAGRARAVLAEHVVATTALGIAQRLVRDVDLLERASAAGSSGLLSGWYCRASAR